MKGAISYSLFGYNRERYANCFDFASYLRGLHLNIRFNRIIYPGWKTILNLDHATYNSPYKKIIDWHVSKGYLEINLCPDNEKLCKAMLWRLKPIFDYDHPEFRYTHVICRDLDSIATYREAQMVQQWIEENKTIHCITDSVSHNIPMMGGMVGIMPGYFNGRLGLQKDPQYKWDELLAMADDIDYNRKGSDQDFLNRIVYPKCSESSTEHFIKGMPHNLSEGNGRHYSINEGFWPTFIANNPPDKFKTNSGAWCEVLKQTNLLAGHVGAAGFYEAPTMKFLYWEDPYKDQYAELENMEEFRHIFYWAYREDLR